ERRLVYNYYILDDRKAMFKIFRYLLEEPDATEDDFIIAVHIAQTDNNRAKAFLWANRGIEKFTDSDMLLALRAQTYLLTNNLDRAESDLEHAYSLNPRNPLTLLGFAQLHFAKNDYTSARESVKNMQEVDPDGIFTEEAKKLTLDINKKEQEVLATASGSITAGTGTINQ
ncbi:MAG: tetratricopeptide repeat protein, partial [Candidatus Gracilibacteria bacterium]|nr:tetratricopeptide repeat protein [Candidatus Gracilibacteria bacterium]